MGQTKSMSSAPLNQFCTVTLGVATDRKKILLHPFQSLGHVGPRYLHSVELRGKEPLHKSSCFSLAYSVDVLMNALHYKVY